MADGVRSLLIKFLGDSKGLKGETENVKTSLSSVKQSIADADGAAGKFKAGVGGAFSYAKDHAGQFAMAGSAALIGFGVKAVGAFVDTSKAAVDMGAAVGLGVEDASRWIAVGDDFGVTAEQLTSGLGKVGKSLDSGKWEKYGVATRDAGGNARDVNDILIDSLDMLGKIENETERARVGNDLFGKGYASLAPLVGKTADEYERMLGSVEKGQVITAKEAAKAERMRLAQDSLQDAVGELTLAVGSLVASLAPLIEKTAEASLSITDMIGPAVDAALSIDAMDLGTRAREAGAFGSAIDTVGGILVRFDPTATDAAEATEDFESALDDAGRTSDDLAGKTVDLTEKTRDGAAAQESVTDAIEDRIKAEQDLYAELLSQVDANYAYMSQVRDTEAQLADYNAELADGTLKGDELTDATERARQSMVDAATAYADTSGAAKDSKGYIDDMVLSLENQRAALDPSSPLYQVISGYIDQLKNIPKLVSTAFEITGPGKITLTPGGGDKSRGSVQIEGEYDTGGVVGGPVGSPQLILAHGGETVLPTHKGTVTPTAVTAQFFVLGNIDPTSARVIQDALDRLNKGNR